MQLHSLSIHTYALDVGLKSLRNQLTSKPEEGAASNDERLRLVKEWLEISPGAQDVFALMENQNQVRICALHFLSQSYYVLLASNYCYMPFDTGMHTILNIWACKHVTRPANCQEATDIPMDEEARLTANWYPS